MMSEDLDLDDDLPSKSQIKRECDALQKVGEALIALKQEDLDSLALPEELRDAVLEARRLKSRSGLKRQRQYIGKIMRDIDGEDVSRQLDELRHKHDRNNAVFHRIESWRDRMIAGDDEAVTELHQSYHRIDHQHLNQLIRQARKEARDNKPPTAARKLFRYLREIVEAGDELT